MKPDRSSFTIDLGRLRVLEEVAERGSVTAAAASLHLTPSAVSQQLATLARDIGVPLVVRAGRGIRVTDEGFLLLRHGSRIRTQLEDARTELHASAHGDTGTVTLGSFASAIPQLVAPAVRSLATKDSVVEIAVHQTQPPACFTALNTGALDLVVTVDWRQSPHRGDHRFERRELLADPFLVALPDSHPLAQRSSLSLSELADEPWVAGDDGAPCLELMLTACATNGFNPRLQHRTEDWSAVVSLVAAGGGVALIPRLAVPVGCPGVTLRSLGTAGPARSIVLLARTGTTRTPRVGTVVDALVSRARALAGA